MTTSVESGRLFSRIASGDPAAVRECIARYSGLVWSLARRFLYDSAEAEDAVQDIFVDLWRSAGRYNPEVAGEETFVAMIARRRLIDRRRRRQRESGTMSLGDMTVADSPDRWEGERKIELSDEARRAAEALDTLSAEQQRVIRLSVYHGWSHEKIAASTGLPLGTVKTHARRGLIRIREVLGTKATIGRAGHA